MAPAVVDSASNKPGSISDRTSNEGAAVDPKANFTRTEINEATREEQLHGRPPKQFSMLSIMSVDFFLA